MATQTRDLKRNRESNDEDNDRSFVRSRIWSQNNRIVVQAENTQFCVFRDVLSTHSRALKEMVDNLPFADVNGVDYCPLLKLSDTAKDMECFLEALINDSYFRSTDLQPLQKVSSLLRLGKKYEALSLKDDAIDCMQAHCKELQEERKASYTKQTRAGIENFENPACLIDIVNLAREVGVRSILPDVFTYCAANLTTEQIIKGVERDDGTLTILSPDDQKICISGRDRLRAAQLKELYAWLDEDKVPSPACPRSQSGECGWLKARQAARMFTNVHLQPLLCGGKLPPSPTDLILTLCPQCRMVALQSYLQGYGRLRENLPSFFDLPGWKGLTP